MKAPTSAPKRPLGRLLLRTRDSTGISVKHYNDREEGSDPGEVPGSDLPDLVIIEGVKI